MKLSVFDYELPRGLIAQYPGKERDSSRLLVLDRGTGVISHKFFRHFIDYIDAGDALVLNDTKVINARLFGKRLSGGKVEIFLLEKLAGNKYKALLRPFARMKENEEIVFENSNLKARVIPKAKGESTVDFIADLRSIGEIIDVAGEIPLPPYIKRKAEGIDSERYQTVYANTKGASASPTAGLHFTKEILGELAARGITTAYVTLHVSYGTFAPVKEDDIEKHRMHSEYFEMNEETAARVTSAKKRGGRIFAVGTTSCRVLESCAEDGGVRARKGRTDLFIYPSYKFKMVDALLTNFHFPRSTLLMLVSAFAGRDLIFKAYKEAIAEKYKFFSYGDAMLIL